MYNPWEENAKDVEAYGGEVNWEQRYYLCLECGEPIYECDWIRSELLEFFCPICEWEGD